MLTLDHGFDVFARERLVLLERVRDREHRVAILLQQLLGAREEVGEVRLDARRERALEEIPLLVLVAGAGLPAAADADAVRDAVGRDGAAHAPVPLHEDGQLRRSLEVARNPGGRVTREEHLLAGQ